MLHGQNLELLFHHLDELVVVVDRIGSIIFGNKAAFEFSGYHIDSVRGTLLARYLLEGDTLKDTMGQLLRGRIRRASATVVKVDGSHNPVGFEVIKIIWGGEKALLIIAKDISTEMNMRTELNHSMVMQRALLNNIPFQAWLKDGEGVFLAANAEFARQQGVSESEIIGRTDFDFCNPVLAQKFQEQDQQVISTQSRQVFLDQVVKDGVVAWFETSKAPIYNENGRLLGISGIARNITGEVQMQQEQLENLKQQQLLSEVSFTYSLPGGFAEKTQKVLSLVGRHLKVSRVYIFEDDDKGLTTSNTYEWCDEGIEPQMHKLQHLPYTVIWRWRRMLVEEGLIFATDINKLPPEIIEILEPQYIRSLLVYPLHIENAYKGFIGFDECQAQRKWSGAEVELLKTVTHVIATAMQRSRTEEALSASERKYREMVELLPEMVSEMEADGTVKFLNRLALKWLEYTPEEVAAGQVNGFMFLAPEERQRAMEVLQQIVRGEEVDQSAREYMAVTKGGRKFPALIYIKPKLEENQLVGFTGVMVDISELKEVQERLIEAKERAEQASMAKQNFLATMSHEIRTPLNSIVGTINLLKDEDLSREGSEHLETLEIASQNLLGLISDVLDFSKIEAGKIRFDPRPFDLHNLLHHVMKGFQPRAYDKGIELKLHIAPRLPAGVVADPDRLMQIINNLVSNAIKFTEQGMVKITADADTLDHDGGILRITVEDTGIGIPSEKLEQVFDIFYQLDNERNRRYQGTGLGLAIARRLVHLQGGSLEAESTLGVGSMFSFSLPFGLGSKEQKGHQKDKQEAFAEGLDGYRILLVEDNTMNQKLAMRFLQRWGADVVLAANGREAIEKITESPFDLVLMDLQMPEMDGFEATRIIRNMEDPHLAKIPIVALTASALLEVQKDVLDAGMNDYITKPFNPQDLYKKIVRLKG
jgi:PAS domain S-box-containing protein